MHWLDARGPVLRRGEACAPAIRWQQEGEHYRVLLELPDAGPDCEVQALIATDIWVAVISAPGDAQLRPARSDIPPSWLQLLLQAPPLDAAQAARLKLLAGSEARWSAPPVAVELPQDLAPQPVLTLFQAASGKRAARGSAAPVRLGARLHFRYGATEVDADSTDSLVPLPSAPDAPRFARRQPAAEQAALGSYARFGFLPTPPSWHWQAPAARSSERYWPDRDAALQFLLRTSDRLQRDGWDLRYADDWPLHPQTADIIEGRAESTGTDWFDLHLTAHVGEERINVPALLARTLSEFGAERLRKLLVASADEPSADCNQTGIVCPAGDRLIILPLARVRAMLALILELFDAGELPRANAALRVSRFDLARLQQLEHESGAAWQGEALALARRLVDFRGIAAVAQAPGLQTQLRDYQLQGLAWMQFLREYGLSGVLADEMGLGKTVQTLAHLLCEQEAGRLTKPALVVAPTSVLPNWEREAARFAPALRVLTVHGTQRKALFEQIGEHELVLTSYALLARDAAFWLQQSFHLVVLDEAQFIKNAATQAAMTACALQSNHRLALSGTPMENHLGEIWSLFNFLMPGFLGDQKRFDRVYRRPIEKQDDRLRRTQLVTRLSPFILRRSKDRVASELPAKTEVVHPIRLEGRQRELYETVRAAMDEKVRQAVSKQGLARSHIAILDALLKLRQVCCDPRLLPAAKQSGISASAVKSAGSAKLQALMELLEECRENSRRVLIFSQFTAMLDLIEPALRAAHLSFVRLDGSTQDRAAPVQAFQSGAAEIFLISLKAGGTGLNLTAADTVIHYDPWWNPAVEAQATGRAHRIGQNKPVFVYRLVCAGSIEEKILALQTRKAELATALLDGSAKDSGAISAEDLQQLLAPLPA